MHSFRLGTYDPFIPIPHAFSDAFEAKPRAHWQRLVAASNRLTQFILSTLEVASLIYMRESCEYEFWSDSPVPGLPTLKFDRLHRWPTIRNQVVQQQHCWVFNEWIFYYCEIHDLRSISDIIPSILLQMKNAVINVIMENLLELHLQFFRWTILFDLLLFFAFSYCSLLF